MGIDPLAHHDGVVHQDAQHQDERHDRHGADGNADHREQRSGSQQRDGNAGGHPQRQPKTQEQGEHQQHQQQTAAGVLGQRIQPVHQVLGFVLPDGDADALGQVALRLLQVCLHFVGDRQHILLADP